MYFNRDCIESINQFGKYNVKERVLKAAREKETVTFKGVLIRVSADFS